MNTKLVFVILQYMASNETVECVNSVRRYVGVKEYKIIIVDNCSPDDSFQIVDGLFSQDTDVILLRANKNLGFARGNNLGFQYAVKNLDPDYIVLLNNDVVLFQDGLYEYAEKKRKEYDFAVLGPMILTGDGKFSSNPVTFRDTYVSRKEMLELMKKARIKRILTKAHIYRPLDLLFQAFIKKRPDGYLEYSNDWINVRLHGSFMIFSRRYIERFPEGLDSRTFMYGEETFLQFHVLQAGMKLVYSPAYSVYHKEDMSTKSVFGTGTKKMLFMLKNNLRSSEMYLEMLDGAEQDET